MKQPLTSYFIASILLGTFIYFAPMLDVQLPRWVRFYVNDFLITPIVLYICLQVLKRTKNNNLYKISVPIILYLCTLYSVLFEVIFPKYLVRYTQDCIDIALYFAGGFVFYILQKKTKT